MVRFHVKGDYYSFVPFCGHIITLCPGDKNKRIYNKVKIEYKRVRKKYKRKIEDVTISSIYIYIYIWKPLINDSFYLCISRSNVESYDLQYLTVSDFDY